VTRLDIPSEFQRNSPSVLALGVEHTGSMLIDRGNALLGWRDLSGKDLLDIGCGVRFTQTLINRDMPIGSYTGVDVDAPLIAYLTDHVKDNRFAFHHWDIHNAMYHTAGEKLTAATRLPFARARKFDIVWLYSVITHSYPQDTGFLLRILRRHIKKGGALVFSAFIDDTIDTFDDRIKDQPLLNAFYNEKFLRRIVSQAGWRVDVRFDEWPDVVMQNLFVCRPAFRWWRW
jgi:SAM-dependent methyltransferase